MAHQNVLITGGGSGIGKFLAQKFADLGYTVFITLRQLPESNANTMSRNIHPILIDVRKKEQIEQAYHTLKNDFGIEHLDVLINNAGSVVPGALSSLAVEQVHAQFDDNVFGALRITQKFLPLLKVSSGKIIAVGSMSSRMSIPFIGAYGASKSALKQLFWALRLELKPWNIGVFHLELGNFNTPIWKKSLDRGRKFYDPEYESYMTHALEVMEAKSAKTNDIDQVWHIVHKIVVNKHYRFNSVIGKDARYRRWATLLVSSTYLEHLLTKTFKLKP